LIGSARWLELRRPPPASRLAGIVWTGGLLLAGLILLFYREA
jgi:hypothetical protein